jgi:SAM-dependent methyltransferase
VDRLHRELGADPSHWWYFGRSLVVRRLAGCGLLLDVGAGLDTEGLAVDVDRASLSPGGVQATVARLPFADGSFDRVVASDVLEHVDDDAAAMREVLRVLRPGGRAVVTVPAHPFLYGRHDRLVGHRRRYTKARLRRLARGARVSRLTYWNSLLFLPSLAVKLADPPRSHILMSDLPRPLNSAARALMRLEDAVLGLVDLPFGTSLVMVVEK